MPTVRAVTRRISYKPTRIKKNVGKTNQFVHGKISSFELPTKKSMTQARKEGKPEVAVGSELSVFA